MKWIDLLLIISFVVLILTGVFSFQYYFNYKNNECLANPLIYGAKQLEETYGFEFIGSGWFRVPVGTQALVVQFSSTNISIKK